MQTEAKKTEQHAEESVKAINLISFKDVAKIYSGNPLPSLAGLNFEVADGEFFCIVGPSGCGKSTILKIIAGLEEETSGEVVKPDKVAMVFQSGALLPWLNVFENVCLGLKAKGVSNAWMKEEAYKFIEMVGLSDYENKYPRDLSGGQRQRVGLARALAVSPKVLLLDEPFSALDTGTTEELHKDLIKIWKTTKKTIVMVSHSIEEAVSLAGRIMLMKSGKEKNIYNIELPYPRRELEADFIHHVQTIRKEFFK
ncbi:MAG: ABC transporter ATP-binding protein [Candidatus Doudnabacteria bacterium]|nr:ABC transporter ATP-binding protein [Candidatus Doudnabacteria bacterium]